MKVYFVHDGKQQHGPYSLEELKHQSINKDSLIWTEQMSDWTPAGQIDSLKPLFATKTPPPLKQQPGTSNATRNFTILGILSIVIALAAFMMLRPKTSSATVKVHPVSPTAVKPDTTKLIVETPQPNEEKPVAVKAKATVPKAEKFNAAKYLVKTTRIRRNFVGQTVIEGNIKNTSTTAVFKDIALDVTYLSKTGAVISTQRFVVYEVAKPNKPVAFKFKIRSPVGTNNVSAEIVDAFVVK